MAPVQRSFLQACRGEKPERTPVWIMRQAGRYLPEYRAVREKVSFEQLIRTPELCAEVTRQPLARFDLDAAILFSDILAVLDLWGVEVRFNPAPRIESPVRTIADIDALHQGDVEQRVGYVAKAVEACKHALMNRVPLIGFCGAPFTTASYLIEGGATADFRHTKALMFSEAAAFERLMSRLTTGLVAYLQLQVKAGVDALQIFDSWAGALTPSDYREHVLPHVQRLVDEARKLGVPVILFVRGNANLLAQASSTPADVLGIDWTIDLADAIDVVGHDRVVQGNLDPLLLSAPEPVLVARTRQIVEVGRQAKAHVFNLGHGILPDTDPDAVARLVDAVHDA